MKIIIFAGPPTAGKTSIIKHIVKRLKKNIAYFKMDVQFTDDDTFLKKLGVPTKKVYSGELCPDHCFVLVLKEVIEWAEKKKTKILLVETAGLCFRCSPYINNALGIAVLEATSGMNLPQKIGPIISLADMVAVTKIDLISQAEREVFRTGIQRRKKPEVIIEVDALRGINIEPILKAIEKCKETKEPYKLRGVAPIGVCTLCVGKREIGWDKHFGILRKLNSNLFYRGE